jgi:glycosyltransferase involved in cell wall biosynthesis
MTQKRLYKNCYVILPALNESHSIQSTIKNISKFIPHSQILVIDNGSTDKTFALAAQTGVQVFREPKRGKGYTVRRGFKLIPKNATAIFIVDADDTYSIQELPIALKFILDNNIDMVVGQRIVHSDASRKPAFKRWHKFGNFFITSLSNLLNPVGIKDSLSGWRVLSPEFVRSFTGGASGFEIESELNFHAFLLQVDIRNLPVAYKGRQFDSHSKLKTYSDGFRILKMNSYLFRNYRPFIAYSLLSLPCIMFSLALIVRATEGYLKTGFVPKFPSLIVGTALFLAGILLFATGVILEKIKTLKSNLAQIAYRGFS